VLNAGRKTRPRIVLTTPDACVDFKATSERVPQQPERESPNSAAKLRRMGVGMPITSATR
jgi:hypothetical protein